MDFLSLCPSGSPFISYPSSMTLLVFLSMELSLLSKVTFVIFVSIFNKFFFVFIYIFFFSSPCWCCVSLHWHFKWSSLYILFFLYFCRFILGFCQLNAFGNESMRMKDKRRTTTTTTNGQHRCVR